MEEKQLLQQLTEIAKKEGYVLLPKSYYERLFSSFEQLRVDLARVKKSRDRWKEELKTLKSRKESLK
jgi:hypothetical protein